MNAEAERIRTIAVQLASLANVNDPGGQASLGYVLDEVERAVIRQVLVHCDNNQSVAAKKAGVHRNTFIMKMKKHNITGKLYPKDL